MVCNPPKNLSPDSASLSDSLSSSELELLEALACPCPCPCPCPCACPCPWVPGWASSSSSSAGLLCRAGGGCFSRSCRQIFSLLLIREIEVLRGRGRDRTTGGMQGPISEGNHSRCSQRVCVWVNTDKSEWYFGSLVRGGGVSQNLCDAKMIFHT